MADARSEALISRLAAATSPAGLLAEADRAIVAAEDARARWSGFTAATTVPYAAVTSALGDVRAARERFAGEPEFQGLRPDELALFPVTQVAGYDFYDPLADALASAIFLLWTRVWLYGDAFAPTTVGGDLAGAAGDLPKAVALDILGPLIEALRPIVVPLAIGVGVVVAGVLLIRFAGKAGPA